MGTIATLTETDLSSLAFCAVRISTIALDQSGSAQPRCSSAATSSRTRESDRACAMMVSAAAPVNRGGAAAAALGSSAGSVTAHAATTAAHKLAPTQINRDFMTVLLCLAVSEQDGFVDTAVFLRMAIEQPRGQIC